MPSFCHFAQPENGVFGIFILFVKSECQVFSCRLYAVKNVIAALTEGFAEVEPGVTVSYDPTGSGAGITGATDKTLDIGLSSRALKDDEKERRGRHHRGAGRHRHRCQQGQQGRRT